MQLSLSQMAPMHLIQGKLDSCLPSAGRKCNTKTASYSPTTVWQCSRSAGPRGHCINGGAVQQVTPDPHSTLQTSRPSTLRHHTQESTLRVTPKQTLGDTLVDVCCPCDAVSTLVLCIYLEQRQPQLHMPLAKTPLVHVILCPRVQQPPQQNKHIRMCMRGANLVPKHPSYVQLCHEVLSCLVLPYLPLET
jgi:hypothetical protein